MDLLILDGNSILNRAYYGIKALSNKDGFHTNAIYGFLNIFNKLKENFSPKITTVSFDLKAPTFRHKIYPEYKAQRKGMPDELAEQLPVLKELLEHLGYKIIEKEGFESDDILGTLARICEKNRKDCIIATGDRDMLQLVSDHVLVNIANTKIKDLNESTYTEEKILKEYGVSPKQMVEVKALMGDSSDNIPGIKGIGPKTAFKLIKDYKSIDDIYDNIENLKINSNLKEKLKNGKAYAYLSKKLGTIIKNVPIEEDLSFYGNNSVNKVKAREILEKLEMFSLIKKFKLYPNVQPKEISANLAKKGFEIISCDDQKLDQLLPCIFRNKKIVFSLKFNKTNVCTIYIFVDTNKLFVITDGLERFNSFMKIVLESEEIEKETYNCKDAYCALLKNDIELNNVTLDVMLADYLLNPEKKDHSLKSIAERCGIYLDGSFKEKNKIEEGSEVEKTILCKLIATNIKKNIESNKIDDLLYKIEQPLTLVLARMQNTGFLLNKSALTEYSKNLRKELSILENKIHEFLGKNVNINSPKQLGVALFEELGLPVPKGNKTKSYSTNAQILEFLKNYHPVINLLIKYRTISKLDSTYCNGLLNNISEKDGRIHSIFNQVETKTGRLSSLNPNLQNIPVKTSLGKEFRNFFIAEDGNVLIDADYSQIELRVLAHISGDETMVEAFKNGNDIHAIVASEVFNIPISMVTDDMRNSAKVVNFGIIYGMSAFSLSKELHISRKEAERYIENYFMHYPKVKKYFETVINMAKETGYVETLYKRKLRLPDLCSKNFQARSAAERLARNMPIQGTAADIIKIAMVKVDKELRNRKLASKLILQIHDELIIESPKNEEEIAKKILKTEMQNAVKLSVPLTVNVGSGENWFLAKR